MSSPWSHIESKEACMEFFTCSELPLGILRTNPKQNFVLTEDIKDSFEWREGICKAQSDTWIQYTLMIYCIFVTCKHWLGTDTQPSEHRSKPLAAGQRGWHQKFQQFANLPLSKGFLANSAVSMANQRGMLQLEKTVQRLRWCCCQVLVRSYTKAWRSKISLYLAGQSVD